MSEETIAKIILDKFFIVFTGLVASYFWLALKTIKQDIERLEQLTKHDLGGIGELYRKQQKEIELLEEKVTCLKIQVGKIETKLKLDE